MNECCRQELPKIYTVSGTVLEGAGIKSIYLKGSFFCKPGQFIMVWIPEVDEKPMAVAHIAKTEFAFAYHSIGPFTKACDALKPGDKIGIRGPYGKPFSLRKNSIVVAGGIGITSVAMLIESLSSPRIIYGARDKSQLIYQKRFKHMRITTDDGSVGMKGLVIDALRIEILEKKPAIVYTCGPEVMNRKVFELCEQHHIDCEASLERYMKCGFGICGNCMVDDHILCTEGPVFPSRVLRKMKEFGSTARLKTGRKAPLKEYYAWRS